MGCTDRESNFQSQVFRDGQWWARTGYSPSYEGPIDEIVKKFPDYAEPRFLVGDNVYSAERIAERDVAIVELIGRVALLETARKSLV